MSISQALDACSGLLFTPINIQTLV